MIFRNSIISCFLVFSFYLIGLFIPEKTSNMGEVVLSVTGLLLYGAASIFSFKAIKFWVTKLRQKQYSNYYQRLEILPSLPIVLIWGFLLVAVTAIPFQNGI